MFTSDHFTGMLMSSGLSSTEFWLYTEQKERGMSYVTRQPPWHTLVAFYMLGNSLLFCFVYLTISHEVLPLFFYVLNITQEIKFQTPKAQLDVLCDVPPPW